MPRNGSGVFSPPATSFPALPSTLIESAKYNAVENDVATAITQSIATDGQSIVLADISLNSHKLTGVTDGTSTNHAATVGQIQSGAASILNGVSGTNTVTATVTPALTAYASGQMFKMVAAGANTGAVTLNINSLGAKSVTRDGTTALVTGDILAGAAYLIHYDGTQFQLLNSLLKSGQKTRQTILQQANNSLVIGTGLSVNLSATATPYGVTVPNGFDVNGQSDFAVTIAADVAAFWTALTPSTTNYLFLNRNTTTGAATGIFSTLPYILQFGGTPSTVNTQHTYDYSTGTMFVGNGTVATAVQRTAVGECQTNATNVTSVTAYATRRAYNSGEQTITSGTPISLNHNIGATPLLYTHVIVNKTTEAGYAAGEEYPNPFVNPASGTVPGTPLSVGRLIANVIPGAFANAYLIPVKTTGALGEITNSQWRQKVYIPEGAGF